MNGYNNPFMPNYSQINPMNAMPQQTAQDERVWVSNQQAAESYLLAPGSFVRLWDSSVNRFYEKRADATGRPLPMDIYEYSRVTAQTPIPNEESIKISMDDINARFEEINSRIDKLEKVKKGTTSNAKSNSDDTSV